MRCKREDSPAPSGASNPSRHRLRDPIVRAARAAAHAGDPSGALEVLLRHVLEATGAERAFLACAERVAGRLEPRVLGSASANGATDAIPSRTVLQTALAGRRRFICPDVARDDRLAAGASVRALALRSVLAVPVPAGSGTAAALVVDSRRPQGVAPLPAVDVVDGFAALAACLLSPGPPTTTHPAGPARGAGLVGRNPVFLDLLSRLRRAAVTDLAVLLVGESGSGKEGLAHLVHDESPRREGPFVAINCAAIPESLLESELFGAARGAYTGAERDRPGLLAAAHGGTLFLDEIGDMPPALQGKLLRVLQEGRVRAIGNAQEAAVDVRVVAATHRDLESLVARSAFRADLFWRVAVARFDVPPLRERPDDIALLAEHLIARLSRRHGLRPARLDASAIERLRTHAWPGNVRELETVLARALLEAVDGRVRGEGLGLPPGPRARGTSRESLEIVMIRGALADSDGNLTRAASRIGWSRQKLYRRIGALGLARGPVDRLPRLSAEARPDEGS